jgi:hypothetical protein
MPIEPVRRRVGPTSRGTLAWLARLRADFVALDPRPPDSDPRGLAGFSKALELLAATALARFLVVSLAPHFLAEAASFAQFSKAPHRILNRLPGPNSKLHHNRHSLAMSWPP